MTSETQTPTTIKWLPTEWIDEISPLAQAEPNAFIQRLENGAFRLFPTEDRDTPAGELSWQIDLMPGEVVEFSGFEELDTIEIDIFEDRTFEADGEPSAKANHFWIDCETGAFGSSLEQVVEDLWGWIGENAVGRHDVVVMNTDHKRQYRFEIDAETGNGRLVQVEVH